MPGIFNSFAPLLKNWGYLAVGGLVLVEDFGVPVPGETVLIAASIYAGNGNLNVVGVAAIAFCAAVIGDNIGYAIGRFGGHRLVERFGRYIFLTPARVARAEGFFSRYGGRIVIVARFIEGLRQANGIIAGLSEMHWRKFFAFNAIGAALWVATWVSVGAAAGSHIVAIYNWITRLGLYALILLGVVIVALIVRHVRRRRRGGHPGPEPAAASGDAATTRPEHEEGHGEYAEGERRHAGSDGAPAGQADTEHAEREREHAEHGHTGHAGSGQGQAGTEQGQAGSEHGPAGHADSEHAESEQAER
jgi:membrane protein DedA with SNARE-associated domain